MDRVKILAIVLAGALATSVGYNVYLARHNPDEEWTKTFAFCWSPEEQNITEGILWVNFTFKTVGENLSIIVEINDDETKGNISGDTLFLVFDKNRNGKIDYCNFSDTVYSLAACNYSFTGHLVDTKGRVYFVSHWERPIPSPYHICIWKEGIGYTFNIVMSLEEIGSTGIVYAIYFDEDWPIPRELPPGAVIPSVVYVTFSYL